MARCSSRRRRCARPGVAEPRDRARGPRRHDRRARVEAERVEQRAHGLDRPEHQDHVGRGGGGLRGDLLEAGREVDRGAAGRPQLGPERVGRVPLTAGHEHARARRGRRDPYWMMMADCAADPNLGRVVAGYRIEERIGRGGMGVVYRARAPQPPAPGRDQADRPRAGRGRRLPRAVQPRGPRRRRPASPERRHRVRRGRGRRPALPGHAVHRGLGPRRRAADPGAAAPLPRASTCAVRWPPRSTPRTGWG